MREFISAKFNRVRSPWLVISLWIETVNPKAVVDQLGKPYSAEELDCRPQLERIECFTADKRSDLAEGPFCLQNQVQVGDHIGQRLGFLEQDERTGVGDPY